MKRLLTLDQRIFDPQTDTTNRASYYVRRAARAVATDLDGAVGLLYSKKRHYYKLPGGGIEQGEEVGAALVREIKEELGCLADITSELGKIIEWRDAIKLKQISYCFTAQLTGKKDLPSFTEGEIADGFEIVWCPSVKQAIELLESTLDSKDLMVKFMVSRDITILKTALVIV